MLRRRQFCKASNLLFSNKIKKSQFYPIKRTNLETKLLTMKHMLRPKCFLPWPTKLCFESGIFWMCVTSPSSSTPTKIIRSTRIEYSHKVVCIHLLVVLINFLGYYNAERMNVCIYPQCAHFIQFPETDLEVVEAHSMPLKALQVWWLLSARDISHYIHSDKKLQKTINLQEAR